MDTAGRRRALAVVVALGLLASTVGASVAVGVSDAAAGPGANGVSSAGAAKPTSGGTFAADTVAPAGPQASTDVSLTATGGRAAAVATDDVFASASSNVSITQELRLTPDEPGSVGVTLRYDVPERVTELRPTLPERATVTGTDGFGRAEGRTYEWDGETAAASITVDLAVNETADRVGPEAAGGRYLFVDAGEWALAQRPAVPTEWAWRGPEPVGVERAATTAGPGAAGEWMAYLGATETYERQAHGQHFRLVVPERATLAESPSAILDSLSRASDQLRVGDRDDEVTAFAAPTTTVEWGVRGLQYGDTDMWVRDAERLDTAENTWLHEYVHARQDYETAADARWTTEAFATYYAGLLALEQNRTEFDALQRLLARGSADPQASAVLTEPATWRNAANYWKGSLVAGELDRQTRLATDSGRSLQAVFSAMNAHQDPVGAETVLSAVETTAGPDARETAARLTTAETVPDVWSRSAHLEAFGEAPARIAVGFAEAPFAASGPYRNATVAATDSARREPTVALYAGETLTVTGRAENVGEAAGEYQVRFGVDGRVVDSASGSLQPGDAATHTFARTFATAGERVFSVGAEEVTVSVREPAQATVTGLAANRTTISGGGAVELTATVENSYDVPAVANLSLSGEMGTVFDRRASLGPGETRTVSSSVTLSEPGEYSFAFGEQRVVVTVERAASGDIDGSSGVGPGFGPLAAVVGLLVAAARLARRRR